MDIKAALGALSVAISFGNLLHYLWHVYYGRVRPHLFSWLIWALVAGVAAAGQIVAGAGSGAWITVAICVFSLVRLVACFTHGEKRITRSDWVCLAVCLVAIVLWRITNDPLLSVMLVTFVDGAGIYPTLRKSWQQPFSENITSFFLFGFVSLLGALAVKDRNLTTLFYPCGVIFVCWSFCLFLWWRRLVRRTGA